MRRAYIVLVIVLLMLYGNMLPVPAMSEGHPLIKSVYIENMNPDSTLYLGIEYTMEIGVVPGADLSFMVRPLVNKTYSYRYSITQGRIKFAVFGSPGKYNLTLVAKLGDIVDTYTMVIEFVTFSPAFKVELVNEKYPMSSSPALIFRVVYLGNGGSVDRYTPVKITPYVNDYAGKIKGKVMPTSIVFGGEIREVYVNMSVSMPEAYYPATIELGLIITSYGMLVGIYKFPVNSEELKEYFKMKPVNIKISADGYTAVFTMKAGEQIYTSRGNTVTLPVLYPVDKVYVNLTILDGSGRKIYGYSNTLSYREYVEELEHWLSQNEKTVYFKTDNSTQSLLGVYMVEYPNGTSREIAYVSKILGLPGKPENVEIVPGTVLYAKGVVSEIHVPVKTTSPRQRGSAGASAFLPLVFFLIIVFALVLIAKKKGGLKRRGGKEEEEEEKEAVEIPEEQLESILEKIVEKKE